MYRLKAFISGLIYLFLNYFVSNIPCWFVRRFFYVLFGMRIGEKSRICMKCVIINPWNIEIASHSIINEGCYIDGRGGIIIGNNVSISIFTIILSASHDGNTRDFKYIKKQTKIMDHVWIGARSTILEGITVGRGCIVGANSLVCKDCDEYFIYVGNPAIKKKKRIVENFDDLVINYYFR